MKFTFENTFKKDYIEVLPSISIGWKPFRFYIGWIFWSLSIYK